MLTPFTSLPACLPALLRRSYAKAQQAGSRLTTHGNLLYLVKRFNMTTPSNPNPILGTDQAPDYVPNSDEKTMAILAHVLSLFFWIIPPLIIYLVKKDDSKFAADHAKEALNFQITMTIVCLALLISIVGILLLWAVGIIVLILIIVATIKASEGKMYRYPLTLRLIK